MMNLQKVFLLSATVLTAGIVSSSAHGQPSANVHVIASGLELRED